MAAGSLEQRIVMVLVVPSWCVVLLRHNGAFTVPSCVAPVLFQADDRTGRGRVYGDKIVYHNMGLLVAVVSTLPLIPQVCAVAAHQPCV